MSAQHTVFPPEVAAALKRASAHPQPGRHFELDRVIAWAQTKYPEFFRKEVHDEPIRDRESERAGPANW